jgi:hypothetical protein
LVDGQITSIDIDIETDNLILDYKIVLNPGNDYILQPKDVCLYISQVKEKDFHWKDLRQLTGKIGASFKCFAKES